MKPEIFPDENYERLYKELQSLNTSLEKKFQRLLDYNLATVFNCGGDTIYVHPDCQWKTYIFSIPEIEIKDAQKRMYKEKYIAYKDLFTKWVLGLPINTEIKNNSPVFLKLQKKYSYALMGYCIFSVPENMAVTFEREYAKTQENLHDATPTIQRIQCCSCSFVFIADKTEKVVECPNCFFTSILKS